MTRLALTAIEAGGPPAKVPPHDPDPHPDFVRPRRFRQEAHRRDHRRLLRPRGRDLARPRGAGGAPAGRALELGRARPPGRRSRGRPAVARAAARRPRRHVGAQPLGMDPDPVRHRQGRPGAGQRQPGLPPLRARVRHEQGRVQGAGPGAGAQDLELPGDHRRPGEGGQAAPSQAHRAPGRARRRRAC